MTSQDPNKRGAVMGVHVGPPKEMTRGSRTAPSRPGLLAGLDAQWRIWTAEEDGRTVHRREATVPIPPADGGNGEELWIHAFVTGSEERAVVALQDVAAKARIRWP
jgi:hypothetical protein